MDFDSYNPITNMGGLFVVVMFVISQVALVLTMKMSVAAFNHYLKRKSMMGEGG